MSAKEILKDPAKISKLAQYIICYADKNGNNFIEINELKNMLE